eukprot:s1756_g22.t1
MFRFRPVLIAPTLVDGEVTLIIWEFYNQCSQLARSLQFAAQNHSTTVVIGHGARLSLIQVSAWTGPRGQCPDGMPNLPPPPAQAKGGAKGSAKRLAPPGAPQLQLHNQTDLCRPCPALCTPRSSAVDHGSRFAGSLKGFFHTKVVGDRQLSGS